mgnify:CR=1 FL=1
MIWLGIAFGLVAAFLQSLCYVVSGSYVRRTGRPGWTLTAPQRALTLVPYALMAWFSRPETLAGEESAVIVGTTGCMVMVFLGDAGLFQMQKTVEPSRVAPLQSVKIPIIALISFLLLGHRYSVGQLAGIVLVLASAAVLFGAGRRLGPSTFLWLAACSVGFACSDVSLGHMLVHTRGVCGGVFRSAMFTLGMTGLGSAVLALPAVAVQARAHALPSARECVRYAIPYGAVWLVAMIFLFVCFSLSGVVLGTIAQSTRGLISVALGWFLARHGFADLERGVSASMFVRRAIAAILVMLAMALYAAA